MRNSSTQYAIYLRKSRRDEELEALGEGETLAKHRQALTELADRRGLTVGRVYEEIVSGETIAARPQMQQLLDDVCAGAWKGVLVMEVERLARGNTKDQGEVSEAFAMSGTLIVTPLKTYDPTNEMDEEYFEFGLFMSRREYKTIRRRMQRGKEASAAAGNFIGPTPPYGYDVVRINKKERTLAPNDKAPVVRQIFDWYVNDRLGPSEIAGKLLALGIPTATGAAEWSNSQLHTLLRNEVYTGKIRLGRRRTEQIKADGTVRKALHLYSPGEYQLFEGKHPAIVPQDLFDRAQELFSRSIPKRAEANLRNPLAGLIFCKDCGLALRVVISKEGTAFLVHPARKTCGKPSAHLPDVMEALVEALQAHVADFEMRATNEKAQEEKRRQGEMRAQFSAEIEKQERKLAGLFDFLEDGTYTREDFNTRRAVITARIEKLRAALEELDASRPVDYQEKVVRFSEVIQTLQDPSVSARAKNHLLKDVVSRIEYDRERVGTHKGGAMSLDVFLR